MARHAPRASVLCVLAAAVLCMPSLAPPAQAQAGQPQDDDPPTPGECVKSLADTALGLPSQVHITGEGSALNPTPPRPSLHKPPSGGSSCSVPGAPTILQPQPPPPPEQPCANCTAPDTPVRPRPPVPEPRVDLLTRLEAVENSTATLPQRQDWDQDGIPDPLDPVNLPSESQQPTTASDRLELPDGLPDPGLALLVEPRHREATLLLAKAGSLPAAGTWNATRALDAIEALLGVEVRNALALVLHEGMDVHASYTAPLLAIDVAPAWNFAVPADGTWLLVQADPTRGASAVLGGIVVPLPSRAPSQYSPAGWMDYRWTFMNPHRDEAHCFDPTTHLNGTLCASYPWPDWLRAYSGQAVYALQAAWGGLRSGAVPLSAPLPVAPLVTASTCPGANVGATVGFVESCTPRCPADQADISADCVPNAGTCQEGAGVHVNANDNPCLRACPPQSDPVPPSTCVPTVHGCPSGSLGAVLSTASAWPTCLENCPRDTVSLCIPNQPGVDPCEGSVGAAPFCFANCPPGTGADACIPTYETCPFPTAGAVVNGHDACLAPLGPQSQSTPAASTPALPALPPTASPPDTGEHILPSLFDGTGAWQAGDGSALFPRGHGLDYRFDSPGRPFSGPSITQWSADGAAPTRRFEYEAALLNTPAAPRNLTQLLFAIQPLDGVETGATFAVDGAHLARLLGLRAGEAPAASITLDHAEGFAARLLDATGDGVPDLLLDVPHFSKPWFRVTNPATSVNFRRVEMTGTQTGWVTGGMGAVHRYAGGFEEYPLAGSSGQSLGKGQTTGLHAVSDTEFYVAVAGDCGADPATAPKVAHYQSSTLSKRAFTALDLPGGGCKTLTDVWMSPDGLYGYAGGDGIWFKYASGPSGGYAGGSWTQQAPPTTACAVLDLELSGGAGWLGLAHGPNGGCASETSSSAAMHFDGTSFATSLTSSANIFESRMDGADLWAVGSTGSSGAAYRRSGGAWSALALPDDTAALRGLSLAPGGGAFAVGDRASRPGEGRIVKLASSTTTVEDTGVIPALYGIDIAGTRNGLAVGYGFALKYLVNAPPTVADSWPAAAANTRTWLTASDGGSWDADGDALTHMWDWGDGYTATGTSSSHQYASPGTHRLHHIVTDAQGASVEHTRDITVQAESLALGSATGTLSMASDADPAASRSHHFQVSGVAGKVVKVQVFGTGAGSMRTRAAADAPPGAAGTWPSLGDQGTPTSILMGAAPSDTLHVAVSGVPGSGSLSYSVLVSEVPGPGAPSVTGFASAHNGQAPFGFTAATSHPGGVPSRLKVEWGDASPLETLGDPTTAGSAYYPRHLYSQPGTYTVKASTQDRYGRESAATTNTVTVRFPAALEATGATSVTATSATLRGLLTDLRGASGVQVRFVLQSLADGSTAAPCGWSATLTTPTSPGSPLTCSATLSAGASYRYWLESNDATAPSTSAASGFESAPDLATAPALTAGTLAAGVGSPVSLSFDAGGGTTNRVFYRVVWGDGSAQRVPEAGDVLPGATQTVTHPYAWSGTFPVEVRTEDSTGARSPPIRVAATVTGAASSVGLLEARLDTAVLRLAVGDVAGGTEGRIGLSDGTYGSWTGVSSGGALDWTTPTLSRSATHRALFELRNGGATYALAQSQSVPFQTNRAPTLTAGALPASISHEEPLTYRVTYRDAEGDPPMDAGGNALLPTLTVAGATHDLHPPLGALGPADYKAGAEYTYTFRGGELAAGRAYAATFEARDRNQASSTATAASVTAVSTPVLVKAADALTATFEGDAVGSVPAGFTVDGTHGRYWHVAQTTGANRVPRLALGNHGKAAWFGVESQVDYSDRSNQPVVGSLVTKPLDLRIVKDPVLSFSSYYETEDKTGERDAKSVHVRSRTPGTSAWSDRQFLMDIKGDEGGYGSWRTQAASLAAFAGKEVRIEFLFNSIDPQHNGYLGWLIDDVSVGHDRDGDGLPDGMEASRVHINFARQVGTATMGADGHAKGAVRRLDRPYAEEVILTAQVHVPHPSSTQVDIGASDPYTGESARFTVYDPAHGLRPDTCQASPLSPQTSSGTYDWFGYPVHAGMNLTEDGDGFIRLDLARCGLSKSAFVTQAEWFIDIHDTDPDPGDPARVDGLSVESVGRTSHLLRDSDADGTSDGDEARAPGRDPLGVDADRDGIPEGMDLDDRIPEWIPAGLVTLTQAVGSTPPRIRVGLLDLPSAITMARMQAGGQTLAARPGGQSEWVYDLPTAPTNLQFVWRDASGGIGTLGIAYVQNDHGHALYKPVLTYENPTADHPPASIDLADTAGVFGDQLFWGLADEALPDAIDLAVAVGKIALGLTSIPAFGFAVFGFVAGKSIRMSDEAKPFAAGDVLYVQRAAGPGPDYIRALKGIVGDPGRLLSTTTLSDAMRDGVILGSDSTGSTRIVHDTPAGPIVLRLVGSVVHDAWRWRTGTSPDWAGGVGTAWFVERETARSAGLPSPASAYRNCLRTCGWRDLGTVAVGFHGANPATRGTYVAERPLLIDAGLAHSLRAAYAFSKYLGGTHRGEADDDVLGEMAIGYASWLAASRGLASASAPTPFWDNGLGSVADCLEGPASHQATRRCSTVAATGGASAAWSGSDTFRTRGLEWRHRSTGSLQFQDTLAVDASLAAAQGPAPLAGLARFDNTNRQMAQALGAPGGARVLAAFDWSDAARPEAGLYYQATG